MRIVSGVAILDFSGPLTIGRPAESLRESVRSALDGGQRKLVLNLADVSHTDSAGLGEMVSSYSAVVRRGGAMKVAAAPRRVLEMMSITRLDMLFDLAADEKAAVEAFHRGAEKSAVPGWLDE